MQKSSSHNNLLEHFYKHLSEYDWLEGVDIYQAGKVSQVQNFQFLVTGKVEGITGRTSEVRLKLHPSGKVIQWIECTCRKNRSQGIYCEHIAALMIHIDRENSSFISSLDLNMPIKPPAIKRKQYSQYGDSEAKESKPNEKASQKLLAHLTGSIHKISLVGKGPKINVRLELKPGTISNYELPIDDAAEFLSTHAGDPLMSKSLEKIRVFEDQALLGTKIESIEDEKISVERVIAIPIGKRSKLFECLEMAYQVESLNCYLPSGEKLNKKKYAFFLIKAFAKYLGQNYFFIPQIGYWPLNRNEMKNQWNDLPLMRQFKHDDAAKLVQSGFADYHSLSPIWLSADLASPNILEFPELSSIKIHSEKEGWFQIDPKYGSGTSSISMFDLMISAKKHKRKYIKSGENWVKIPEFITQHDWKIDEKNKLIEVDNLGLIRLKATLGDFDKFVGSKKNLERLKTKTELCTQLTLPDLKHTKLDLRSYQREGLQWLWWLYKNQLHGLLADEMGLGKTHQAMALMSSIQKVEETSEKKENAYFLVVCPTTVLEHWEDKIKDFAPNLNPLKYHGTKRISVFNDFTKKHNTLVTSYGVLLRDIKRISEIRWNAVFLDEAHFVKNNNTATYRAACKLDSQIRICLTGTPMENHLGELKNLFDFLVPGFLGSDEYFRKNFILPIKDRDLDREIALQKLIHPLKLRRNKVQVLKDLPSKVEDIRHCALSPEQVKLYKDTVQLKAQPLVGQMQDDKNPIPFLHVFATLQLLKQICDHPALLSPGSHYSEHESGKFETLKEIISEALDSNQKVVIFSQYVGMINIIHEYCNDKNIKAVKLTGQSRQRGKIIEQFQSDPETKIFIGSLLAGGIGIDLTAASVVIHYDRWWNASKENQATDRVHRIGQKKFVQVMKMVTRGTLEEKIDQMIQKKQKLFNKFLNKDEEIFKSLTREDLISLLQ